MVQGGEKMELLSIKDIYENDELLVAENIYLEDGMKIKTTDVGIKSNTGDVIGFITANSKIID